MSEQTGNFEDDFLDAARELRQTQADLAAARERIAELERERYDILNVKTMEGLTCSEWLARTAKAEAECDSLKKLAGELVADLTQANRILRKHKLIEIGTLTIANAEAALLSAGIATPSASGPRGGPRHADATIPQS